MFSAQFFYYPQLSGGQSPTGQTGTCLIWTPIFSRLYRLFVKVVGQHVGLAVKSEQFQGFKLFSFCPVESNIFDILFCYSEELEISMWAKSILRKVDQLRGSKTGRITVGGPWCTSCTGPTATVLISYHRQLTAEFIKLNQEDHDKQLKPENLHLRLFAQV